MIAFLLFAVVVFAKAQSPAGPQFWTLQQCIDTAVQNNLTILQSDLALRSGVIALSQSKSNRYPNLNSTFGQSANFGGTVDQITLKVTARATAVTSFSLSSGVVVFSGGQLRNAILQNQLNLDAAGFDLQKVRDDISLAVVNAFVVVIYAHEALQNAKLQVQTTQAEMDVSQIFVTAGKRAESDLVQLKAELATNNYNVSVADGSLLNARLGLQQLMEIPFDERFDILAPVLPAQVIADFPSANAVFEAALTTQPIIKSNDLRIKSAEIGRRIAVGARQPLIRLNGGLGTSYSTNRKTVATTSLLVIEPIGYLQNSPTQTVVGTVSERTTTTSGTPFFEQLGGYFSPSISVAATFPIFDNRQGRNNVQLQELAMRAASLNDRLARRQLRQNVEQAWVDLLNARAKFFAAQQALTAEELAFQNLKITFDAQKSTTTDLLVEQNKYFLTQSQLLQARYDFVLKLKVLDFYQGKPLNF